jgi:uncharacterized repeat protein (TIGR03847 family)
VSASFELDPVDWITASAVGPPGERVFYVQARARTGNVTLLAEKEQVRLLAQALLQLLETLPEAEEGEEPGLEDLDLQEPLEADWRVGEMSIEYEDASDRIAIVISEIEDEEEEDPGLPGRARLVATRAQARALAQHALEVVAAGRPRCQFCGYPLETEGHVCPAMNGHRSYRE